MAYCRFGSDSDVYIFGSTMDGADILICCGCDLDSANHDEFRTSDPAAMLEHVAQHRNAGHQVPSRVDERLFDELVRPGRA